MIETHPNALADPATSTPAIEVAGLSVILGDQTALRNVSIRVAAGTTVALVGPNGAGKSTLLRVFAGLLRAGAGRVSIGGHLLVADPWHVRRAVGFVAHQPMLYPELTAQENLRFYARLYGLDQQAARVEAGLRRVDLLDRAADRVETLSRGMLQRLSLARALLHEPSILLLDEAESGLDARAQALLLGVLRDDGDRRTVVLASHDLNFVAQVADRAVFLRGGRVAADIETAGMSAADLQHRYTEALAQPARAVRHLSADSHGPVAS